MHSPHPYALAASARSRIHTQDLGLMDGVNEEIAAMIDGALSDSSAEAPNRWNPAVEADALTSGEITAQSWGFDVERINREHALLLMGSKAVVVNEQTDGPIKDRVRFFSREAFNAWFANRHTEVVGADRKVRVVTWGHAWLSHPKRRQYRGLEFHPNPDGALGTSGYLNLWRGFSVQPSPEGTYINC